MSRTHLKCSAFYSFIYFCCFIFWDTGANACGGDVLMCHAMFAPHRMETYWMHAECCVAFLSVSQRGDECSHWQENQSSLCGAVSRWAGQPLSLHTHAANVRNSYKMLTLNLPCPHENLCFLLAFKPNVITPTSIRHLWVCFSSVTALFSLPPYGETQHKGTFYRDGNENLIF